MTEWRAIEEFPAYEVSNEGGVRRVVDGRVLRAGPDNTGYARVTFSVPGLKRYRYVHRLVALAFNGQPGRGEIVCHRNGDCLDNRAENLSYGTHKSNRLDAVAHGTAKNSGRWLTQEQRASLRLEASQRCTSQLVTMFGISRTYARLVRARERGA